MSISYVPRITYCYDRKVADYVESVLRDKPKAIAGFGNCSLSQYFKGTNILTLAEFDSFVSSKYAMELSNKSVLAKVLYMDVAGSVRSTAVLIIKNDSGEEIPIGFINSVEEFGKSVYAYIPEINRVPMKSHVLFFKWRNRNIVDRFLGF